MQQATVVTLVKRDKTGKITEILLAMKKRGFGKGRWNGVGGKPEKNETILGCARRETFEEISVKVRELQKVGVIKFRFKYTPEFSQDVHFLLCNKMDGVPKESKEVRPKWFKIVKIPYDKMWPDDKFWLPLMLKGEKFTGRILFGKNDQILKNSIRPI